MSLPDGLYKVDFRTELGHGFGVLVLRDGDLRGGDSGMYYVGTYSQDGNDFSAQLKVGRHSSPPGLVPVFGRDSVNITLSGTSTGTGAELTGTAAEAPDISFQATLARLGD